MRYRRLAMTAALSLAPSLGFAQLSTEDIIQALKPTRPLSCYPNSGLTLEQRRDFERQAQADPRCRDPQPPRGALTSGTAVAWGTR